jgi:hypothetical protein
MLKSFAGLKLSNIYLKSMLEGGSENKRGRLSREGSQDN